MALIYASILAVCRCGYSSSPGLAASLAACCFLVSYWTLAEHLVRARPRRAPRREQLLASSAKRGVRRFGYPEKARFVLLSRRLPPVSRDHGLRLRLKSAASSRLPLSRFCRANLEPWAIVPFVRAVRSREVNTSGPSPRVKLSGPQRWSFGRGASPPRLSFRPPAAKPGCCPPSDFKF